MSEIKHPLEHRLDPEADEQQQRDFYVGAYEACSEGECMTCDAYRLLQRQEDERKPTNTFAEAMMRRYR